MIEHAGKFFYNYNGWIHSGYVGGYKTAPHACVPKKGVDETNSMFLSTITQHERYSQNSCPLMVHLFQDFLNQLGIRNIAGSGKVHLQ